ncbi:aldehyde dehydrogenase family protein [Prauserella endophytica]|uniref:aldehyde dehydrogenase (NAD(+)) n=1 Tax=Prauserella endophytica TaxID=1592324 RepID=A0ABY2S6S9_9PSEU|nr:aldehyde dehydrogenase family protein [Prauserella endophytica]TKG71009.1 aldehyde dehydrogenase family protein [Prauserella endophytica]
MDVLPAAYIRGTWQMGDEAVTVTDSADGTTVGEVSLGSTEQAAAAVRAAHEAFPAWSATTLAERKNILRALMTGLQGRSQRIADSATAEVGSVSAFSLRVQAGLPVRALEGTIDAMDAIAEVEDIGTSRVQGLPIGVVAAIAPWNYPLYQIMGKLAPALAAGCTVVVKPPQQAPLTVYDLVAELENAGVPAGVVNVVQGRGPVVGEAFADHPLVDMVSFTGSTAAGSRIAEVAARSVKKVALELGGKSANVFAADADLDRAIPGAVRYFLMNNGQTCSALTRLIVPRSLAAEVEERLTAEVEAQVVGDPRDAQTTVGPLVSAAQRRTVEGYIRKGLGGEGRLLAGGLDLPAEFQDGHYVLPTVFTDVDPKATIAQEEIFGPVLVVHVVDDEEEAIRVANDSPYGLSGGVWSADEERAVAIARRIRTGQVSINGAPFNAAAPFGGFKQSGYGRELGRHGIAEYLSPQSLQFPAHREAEETRERP